MTPITALLAAPLLAAPLPTASVPVAQDPRAEDFTEELERVHRDMQRQKWDKAYDRLREALEAHREQDYVYARRSRIREDMQRIAFWQGREMPDPADLVAGELEDYDADDGDIEIVYDGRQLLEDWTWSEREPGVTFPARMTGKYEVEITGRIYPSRSLWVIVDADRADYYRLNFGVDDTGSGRRYVPGALYHYNDGEDVEELLDETKTVSLNAGAAYELSFEVSESRITMEVDGGRYLKGRRQRGDLGRWTIYGLGRENYDYIQVRVEGEVDTSWIHGLRDAAMSEQRAAFAEAYDEEEHLPEWFLYGDALLNAVEGGGATREAAFAPNPRSHPGAEFGARERLAYGRAVKSLIELRQAGDAEGALARLEELEAEGELPAVVLAWLRLRTFEDHGMLDEALEQARLVAEADPSFVAGRQRLANFLDLAGRDEEAERVHLELLRDLPYAEDAITGLLVFYLTNNRLEDAVAWSNEYARDPRARDVLEDDQRFLVKAARGPAWGNAHEHQSEHYLVRSDLGEEVCKDAARMLESAYTSYSIHLAKVPGLDQDPFRVFIFSGESSYHDYADEAMSGRRENTLGLYSPLTKQLLIRNWPDRDEFHRTILHEGFHQYLDEVLPNPPVWFNEGMASYFEYCEVVNGAWTEGQVAPHFVRILREDPPLPLKRFFALTPEDFYGENVGHHYAQGWALIHFLRNSTREHEDLFEAIFEELREQPSQRVALDAALEGVDLAELDRAFRAHLAEL